MRGEIRSSCHEDQVLYDDIEEKIDEKIFEEEIDLMDTNEEINDTHGKVLTNIKAIFSPETSAQENQTEEIDTIPKDHVFTREEIEIILEGENTTDDCPKLFSYNNQEILSFEN